ncbi:MAG: dicarboxylate/amino acid:cation symporter [Planctomycetaceae bacterium]
MKKPALHIQILIALVLGTIIGILVNPGEAPLDDARGRIEPRNGEVAIVEEAAGEMVMSVELFRERYETLAERAIRDGRVEPTEIAITRRRAHLVEDGRSVTLTYTRRVDGRAVVSKLEAPNAARFVERHPYWDTFYTERGGGFRAAVIAAARFVGDMFLRLLKMVTIPLIVTSLITGVSGLGTTAQLGSMFLRTLAYYAATSLLAITIGIAMVNLIRPGVNAQLPGGGEGAIQGGDESLLGVFVRLVQNMFPENPIQSLAGGDFLAIITFSILFAIFIIRTGGESGETLRRFFQSAFDVVMHLTMFVIALAPIGVLAFMTYATATQGIDIFRTLAWYMLTVFLALVIHAGIVLPLIVKFVGRRSPVRFAKAMSPALMTAFSTASSNGTLPLTMTCVEERAGISNRVSSFVLPLGATINMDGTALYEAVAVLFIAQAYASADPTFTLTFGMQITVAFTALLASVGAAGIPHAGLVMMAIVLQAVGLPLEAQGVIIAVDRVLDMCRTTVNVWSDSCGCTVVARLTGEPVAVPTAIAEAAKTG